MASGSDVACQVSHIVLLDSDFASMPSIVMEGRRVVNNIQRSASLFLVRNIFSFLMAVISLVFALGYPITPAQMGLAGLLTVGIPSLFLALEPNVSLVKGRFLLNVFLRALPGGLTNLILVIGVTLFHIAFEFPFEEMSTICAVVMLVVGLLVLLETCRPLNTMRKTLIIVMGVLSVASAVFFGDFFTLSPLGFSSVLVLAVFMLFAYPLLRLLSAGMVKLTGTKRFDKK
jgi:cation-transporting ATPase E